MIKTFTQDDIVRYLYEQTSNRESTEIAQALLCDAEMQHTYKEFEAIKKQLEMNLFEPSEKTVNSIIDYSQRG